MGSFVSIRFDRGYDRERGSPAEGGLQLIKCGMFDHIEPTDYPSLDWRERDYDRFGHMRRTTTIEECVACGLCPECPLETAIRAREGIAKKAKSQGAALE